MASRTQTPIAIVGLACRLPGNCNSPEEFWKFLLAGRVADVTPPASRFNGKGHYDGTLRPWTMRSPGGMFISADPQDIDAGFFGLSHADAVSMDPQQRQLLEVVYEGLENAGLTLEGIKSTLFGCFVGSYASDYDDMQTRDAEDRAPSVTVGTGRAMLSNRISHFLDLSGPSMTIDTACSGSLVSLDLACRYLDSGDADGAIVAGCNLYMSPEHNMDQRAMSSAASPSGRCWTFDARADGYIKAEAANCLILKRLDDAIRDGDPIRAVIRGTSTNSDGWTPGIASPSSQAQASAIRRAYARAGISSFNETAYLECHGTGTLAGDPIECAAVSSVFSSSRTPDSPLRIGSVKSNIGHSEPAAGLSGMLKAILAVERGTIPGNPTFEIPNPKINFEEKRLLVSKSTTSWPRGMIRRSSVNSFGYGGSNAHAIVEHPEILLPGFQSTSVSSYTPESHDLFFDEKVDNTRRLLVFSANDQQSLKGQVREYIRHLSNPAVQVDSADLAYTLADRRSRLFHRGYVVSSGSKFKESQVVIGKADASQRVGFVFTGQGAQWPRMGWFLKSFPTAKTTIMRLDEALQSMSEPPSWSLLEELCEPRSPEHVRQPEFSQPLVTALQLALVALLEDWGLMPEMVVGHSSGEIAAAVAAGFLSQEDGIKVAYLRGKAAKDLQGSQSSKLGMMSVGLGSQQSQVYLAAFPDVHVACNNSPKNVTLAGPVHDLEALHSAIKADGHFARILMIDLAYHSPYMSSISAHYGALLRKHCPDLGLQDSARKAQLFSTVHGGLRDDPTTAEYWVANMLSQVQFEQGAAALMQTGGVDHLIEVGPNGALAGPVGQIKQALGLSSIQYHASFKRNEDPTLPLYELAGKLFVSGLALDLSKVNKIDKVNTKARVITDLPNYQWNHSVKYWYESLASKDWRLRPFPVHDLLGSKVFGTSWTTPSWKRIVRLKDTPWIRDHQIGSDIIFPASGYIAMAAEAAYQMAISTKMDLFSGINNVRQASYRLRDIRFPRALVLEEDTQQHLYFFLSRGQGPKDSWLHFRISSLKEDNWTEHCNGYIKIGTGSAAQAGQATMKPFKFPSASAPWYKHMQQVGFNFGPVFQNLNIVESVAGKRTSRAKINFPAPGKTESTYAIHPAIFDTFFQAGVPSIHNGHRTQITKALVPRLIDEIFINASSTSTESAIASTEALLPPGKSDKTHNYTLNATVYDSHSGSLLASVKGLHYSDLSVPNTRDAPTAFMRLGWKPDVSLLPASIDLQDVSHCDEETSHLSIGLSIPRDAAYLMALAKHKLSTPSVLDIDMTGALREMDDGFDDSALRRHFASLKRYVSTSSTSEHMLSLQKLYSKISGMEFHLLDPANSTQLPFDAADKFDIIVVRMPSGADGDPEAIYRTASNLCVAHGFVILIQERPSLDLGGEISANGDDVVSRKRSGLDFQLQHAGLSVRSRYVNPGTPTEPDSSMVFLCSPSQAADKILNLPEFSIVTVSSAMSKEWASLMLSFKNMGWTGSSMDLQAAADQPRSKFLLLDDSKNPLLSSTTEANWASLQKFLTAGHEILWVTSGSQLNVSSPSNALIHGFARSLRGEDTTLSLTTLDLSSIESVNAAQSIMNVMINLSIPQDPTDVYQAKETEYCERNGLIHVSRVLPDEYSIKRDAETEKPELSEMWFRKTQSTLRLCCERVGAMDSLCYKELANAGELGDGEVEVEMMAAGLNYKDVIISLGIVTGNEEILGLEGSGIITKVGKNVTSHKLGDRVIVHSMASFSNRNRIAQEKVIPLPDWMTFEQGATMSVNYFTVLYSLIELTQLKKGQKILIHSGAGGVGLAAIHFCRYIGADIFVTVGTDEKRQFLQETYGIPSERIFSSRNNSFGAAIRALTNGQGVDIVLNSLTGELLDESWRLLNDHGTLLEIGKKDILERNPLSMEPFDRNCTFRGIDVSRPSIVNDLELIGRVMGNMHTLLNAGHIQPISPMKVFPFNKIADAMRYMRSGEHIGKIVISNGAEEDIKVPVRPLQHRLSFDPNAAYLIVGGLKGLCGSLAVHMAQSGAKNLVIMSRSGCDDQRSQGVIQDLRSLGASVQIAKADISNVDDVKRAFQESRVPIKGIVHGAMLLRDKTFESMAFQEFQDALSSKFAGTWNLHIASAEQANGIKLEFFTMLSSISGVVGTAGQANYAAGNSFQDAFARYRHSLGLAAHTVDLGIIEDVGYMSEHQDLTDRVRSRSQLSGIREGQLHDILRFSILQQTRCLNPLSSSQMITGLPYPLPDESPILSDKRFHTLLVPQGPQAGSKTGSAESDEIRAFHAMKQAAFPAEQLIAAALKLVNKRVVQLLGLTVDIEESKPLNSYGIDSLAAVDVRNWLKTRLGVELTTLDILNSTNLKTLCTKIVEKSQVVKSE